MKLGKKRRRRRRRIERKNEYTHYPPNIKYPYNLMTMPLGIAYFIYASSFNGRAILTKVFFLSRSIFYTLSFCKMVHANWKEWSRLNRNSFSKLFTLLLKNLLFFGPLFFTLISRTPHTHIQKLFHCVAATACCYSHPNEIVGMNKLHTATGPIHFFYCLNQCIHTV